MRPTGRVVLAGGGTAGHVVPALALADELVRRGVPREAILFVGSSRGQETRLVPQAGFELWTFGIRGLDRGRWLAAIGRICRILGAGGVCLWRFLRQRPAVVVSLGGYACLPASMAAVVLRIPILVVNLDVVPGVAARIVAPFARAIAAAWPGSGLPGARVTGLPLRRAIFEAAQDPLGARRKLGVPEERSLVGVVGGSLGSRRINQAVFGLVELWRSRSDLAIWHVVGERDWPERPRIELAEGGLFYRAVSYQEEMGLLLAAADVVVGRAGAGSIAELAAMAKPSILVPLPNAPGSHQERNAALLAHAGAAVVVEDRALDAKTLARVLDELLSDRTRLKEMAESARGIARPHGAEELASMLEDVVGR